MITENNVPPDQKGKYVWDTKEERGMAKILEVRDLTVKFGEFTAVDHVSLSFNKGEITSIVGPNGAGKTTFLRLISGELAPTEGEIIWNGEDITKHSFSKSARKGISRCFQVASVFNPLSVTDNLIIAGRVKGISENDLNKKADELLEKVDMVSEKHKKAESLSHGKKRMLELCMSFIQEPGLLLADEVAAGLAEKGIERVDALIKEKASVSTPLIIEHRLGFVFDLSDRVIVMHGGTVLADGTPDEIKELDTVKKAYFGEL